MSKSQVGGIKGVVEEVDEVVAKARMFRHKPDGEATLRMLQVRFLKSSQFL